MNTISRTYHLVGAKRIAEATFDATPLKATCGNGHAFPYFGSGECPVCKSTEIAKPDPLPDRRILEFHPEPGSPETFVGDGVMKFVVQDGDPVLGELAIDSDWTVTFERAAAKPEPMPAIPLASPDAKKAT
jgi:hypothetical protein